VDAPRIISHVDMVLGDGARERGALADEIPGDDAHAGIGFVIDPSSRLPIRFGRLRHRRRDRRTRPPLHTPPFLGELLPFPPLNDEHDNDRQDGNEQYGSEGGVA
jgi:hypothetical protein